MKRYIVGMSTDRKTIHYKLFNASEPLVIHLLKLIEFPNAQAKVHWAKEIYSFLNTVPLLKSSKKLPSYKFLYNEICSYNDVLDSMIDIVRDLESDEQFAGLSSVDCLPIVQEYQRWLAQQLSTSGRVTLIEVMSELSELGLIDKQS